MLAVVAIYPDEVRGWLCGVSESNRLRILSFNIKRLEDGL